MLFVQVLLYLSVAVFVIGVGARIWKYARAPIHLRWELYPVAHEPDKKEYGGSYFEELEWWKKPIKKSFLSELTAMAEEIFLLKGVYHHNRSLWYVSYPFHMGLYLLVGLVGLLLVGALAEVAGFPIAQETPHAVARAVYYLTILCGYSGLTLALVGCMGLLIKRIKDPALRPMTTPADYCNLGYILVLLLAALGAWLFADQTFAASRKLVASLITFKQPSVPSGVVAVELVLFSVFLLYMPFTRMTHFFAKYFTYHKVRWEDSPNLRGGRLEAKIKEALNFGVSWQAAHIQTGKSWAEVATQFPKEATK